MTTKERIIQQSIEMFNMAGSYHIGIKEIAKALDMSPGNFTYHFPKKADLLLAIQEQMLADARVPIWSDSLGAVDLKHFDKVFRNFYDIQQHYAFYFNNLLYTFNNYPNIAQAYRKATQERFRQGLLLLEHYIKTKRLQPEPAQGTYKRLMKALWMVSIFWTGQQVVLGESQERGTDEQMEVLWSIFLPFLTEKGKEEVKGLLQIA